MMRRSRTGKALGAYGLLLGINSRVMSADFKTTLSAVRKECVLAINTCVTKKTVGVCPRQVLQELIITEEKS